MADEKAVDDSTGRHTAADQALEDTGGLRNQHPALHGDPEGEIAKRSADGSVGLTFHKVFVLAGDITDDVKHPQHVANLSGTAQEAINRGLHPKGEPELVSIDVEEPDRRGNKSARCKYAVEVEPAITDTEAHTTVTPHDITVDNQSSSS
jgi:hypothetical protein